MKRLAREAWTQHKHTDPGHEDRWFQGLCCPEASPRVCPGSRRPRGHLRAARGPWRRGNVCKGVYGGCQHTPHVPSPRRRLRHYATSALFRLSLIIYFIGAFSAYWCFCILLLRYFSVFIWLSCRASFFVRLFSGFFDLHFRLRLVLGSFSSFFLLFLTVFRAVFSFFSLALSLFSA